MERAVCEQFGPVPVYEGYDRPASLLIQKHSEVSLQQPRENPIQLKIILADPLLASAMYQQR